MRSSEEATSGLQITIPWHKPTVRGFAFAFLCLIAFILFIGFTRLPDPYVRPVQSYVPVELTNLNFGSGDGTGRRKGNLTKEGAKSKGKPSTEVLEDAQSAPKQARKEVSPTLSPTETNRLVPSKAVASNDIASKDATNEGNKSVGSQTGSQGGTGLGANGDGRGAGDGFGTIEWGGGGNRTVLFKPLPNYPSGANASQIKIRFTVNPDGSVGRMNPVVKADPLLEKAAIDALKRWRFNRLNEEKDMVGVITFTFKQD